MTFRLALALNGPPKGKSRHRTRVQKTKSGKVFAQEYPDPAGVKYETQLRYVAQQQMGERPPTILPLKLSVEVTLAIAPSWPEWEKAAAIAGGLVPDSRGSGDVDNFLKIVGDSLNGIVWHDDSQIVEAYVFKRYGQAPRLALVVESIDLPKVERPSRASKHAAEATADLFAGAADG